VSFNEALKKAMDDKNRELEELSKLNKANEELVDLLQSQLSELQVTQPRDVDAAERLAELTRQNAKLEMELQEAR
jgi:2-C-methyl-D-erythritol 4-phosphate cytidylyltransferase